MGGFGVPALGIVPPGRLGPTGERRERRWAEYSCAVMGLVVMTVVTVHASNDQDAVHVAVINAAGSHLPMPLSVDLTVLQDAVTKGAVCLDGTPPAYNLDKGFGPGANNWLVHIEGGGWCNNVTSCFLRKHGRLGSSNYMTGELFFSGILSDNPNQNPDFYNWNRVKVRYCDGASFTGDVEEVDPVYKLYFRGERIWRAVMDDLLLKGMNRSEQALLSGCSAGGLTSILHCDSFRSLLPKTAKVKCLGDAGFFVNAKDISGACHIKSYFNDVFTLQQSTKNLPVACTAEMDPTQCYFPQYLFPYIQTPLFILNAGYDSWQIRNILAPDTADPDGHWHYCKLNIKNCTRSQLETMQGYRLEMLNALEPIKKSEPGGMFINSCYSHCQTEMQENWFANDSPKLHNKAIAQAVADWFFDRSNVKEVDCPYPCDSTCHNLIYEQD